MSKAVMTIHGFLTVKEDFGRLYDYFDCYDEVLPVEIPGHNGEVDFDKFTVESSQEAVLTTFDKLHNHYDQVDVVGFSMGGALTTWLCAERDVHRAVLISPSNKYINAMMPFEAAKFYGEVGLHAMQDAEGSMSDRRSAAKAAYEPYLENITTSGKIAVERILKYLSPHTFGVFSKLMKSVNKAVQGCSPIETPALVLWGKLDELVPYSSVKYVLKHFTDAESIVYPDIGHAMLYTNHDDIIINDIMKFLKS